MATLVDTNVLIDIIDPGAEWEEWSTRQLFQSRLAGPIVINPLVYAEMAAGFDVDSELAATLPPSRFDREDLPWEAAFLAGRAYVSYLRSGGPKRSPLPDFYIGAHALVRGHRLLTRDAARYRAHFPDLDIIAPDTHP